MFQCGAYIRSSIESDSIELQREVVDNFIQRKKDLLLVEYYVDNGFSGLDFKRPNFSRLCQDIESGKINCIIVKDLSRIGRDYVWTGMYVGILWPQRNVRIIAINDGYDSYNSTEVERYFFMPLRNYINDAYSRDISKKVRSSLYTKMRNGDSVVCDVAYGYIKEEEEYKVDINVKGVIVSIFEYALEGYSLAGIAKILNDNNIKTPYTCKKTRNIRYTCGFVDENKSKESFCWYPMMVRRILTDKIYIGALVQGKVRRISYKIKKNRQVSEQDRFVFYNHHESIIDERIFFITNYVLKLDCRRRKGEEKYRKLSGLVRYADVNGSKRLPRMMESKIEKIIDIIVGLIDGDIYESDLTRKNIVMNIRNIVCFGRDSLKIYINI